MIAAPKPCRTRDSIRPLSSSRPSARPVARAAAAAGIALALAACIPAPAPAAPTQYWTLRAASDYTEAELDGVSLGPDGALSRGPLLTPIELPGSPVVWSVLPERDAVLLGTGPGGLVLTVRGQSVSSDSCGDGQALALARGPDGALYVGTGPHGHVSRLAGGKATLWFDTEQKYVWALAFVGQTLYAATGPAGKLFAIDGEGKGRVVFDARAAHLTALAPDGHGGLFVGAAGRGVIYDYAAGSTRAVFEAPEKEIRALAYDGHALFAAALAAPPLSLTGDEGIPQPASGEGQRAAVYRIVPDSSIATHWVAPQGLIYGLALRGGELWAATGSRAALYRVDPRGRATALWAGPEGQATAVAAGEGEMLLATSNPSRLYRVREGAGAGRALSPVLDAKRIARWGRLWWEGDDGVVAFDTRSGNTADPDSTWSAWRATEGEPAHVRSPSARFLQWRLRLEGSGAGRPAVRSVGVAYGEVNQAPRIEEFTVYPVPGHFYEGEINLRRDPITQELPDGRKVQWSVDLPRKGSTDALPPWAQGLRPISWKASDPNGDAITYRLSVRRQGENAWTPIAVGLTTGAYTWDTSGLPDGHYEVELTASDADANPPGQGLEDHTIAGAIEIDHTPPKFAALETRVEGDVLTVRGRVADAGLFVSRVDVGLDDGEWYPAAPDDGLWDGPSEAFTMKLEGVPPGAHLVRVRATDAIGNAAFETRSIRVGR